MTTIDDIRRLLHGHGGIVDVSAGYPRELPGAGRLGCHVPDDIVRLLEAESATSISPRPMRNDQRQVVTLLDRGVESIGSSPSDLKAAERLTVTPR